MQSSHVHINMGNSLFNKDRRVQELTQDNIKLSTRLQDLGGKLRQLVEENKALKLKLNKTKDSASMDGLQFEQLRLNHLTLDSKFLKMAEDFELNKIASENKSGKIDALERQQEIYLGRIMELENDLKIRNSDMETLEKRNAIQKSEIHDLKLAHEKSLDNIAILEKSMIQKNKHIQIFIKEKERTVKTQKNSFKEFLNDKIDYELREDRTETENYILDKNADLKSQVALLRDKIMALKEQLGDKDKEIQKVKDDNFYLVTRLKNLRGK